MLFWYTLSKVRGGSSDQQEMFPWIMTETKYSQKTTHNLLHITVGSVNVQCFTWAGSWLLWDHKVCEEFKTVFYVQLCSCIYHHFATERVSCNACHVLWSKVRCKFARIIVDMSIYKHCHCNFVSTCFLLKIVVKQRYSSGYMPLHNRAVVVTVTGVQAL